MDRKIVLVLIYLFTMVPFTFLGIFPYLTGKTDGDFTLLIPFKFGAFDLIYFNVITPLIMIILMVDTITSISHIRLIDIFMVIFAPISLCLTALIPIAFYEFWLNKNREKFIEKLSKKGYKIIDSLKNIEF
ncbi:MAG: hypothetical protein ACTSQP_06115 [Promethearchaeota archaeon]